MKVNNDTPLIVIQSLKNQSYDFLAEGVRISLIRAALETGLPLSIITDFEAEAIVLEDGVSYLISSDMSTFEKMKKRFEGCYGVNHVLIFCPTEFPGATNENDRRLKELKAALTPEDVVVTDSELSRFTLEAVLGDMRASVVVIEPDFSQVPRRAIWTEEAASDAYRRSHTISKTTSWSYGSAKEVLASTLLVPPGWDWGRAREVKRPDATVRGPKFEALNDLKRLNNAAVVENYFSRLKLDGAPLTVGVLGHKLSFIDELAANISRTTGSKVILDEWKYLSAPSDKERTKKVLDEADVVIGEWARPNNVWIQDNAPEDTRLIVRAHRYEVTTDFPARIDMDRYSAAVVIVPWVGRELVSRFGWPADKMVFIPNFVDNRYFKREKLAGANFTLGIAGVTPHLKRLDLALDLLKRLRSIDPRFTLRVRGTDPQQHPHWESNPEMRDQWGSIKVRMRFDSDLRDGVHFDPPGRDMAGWLEQVGFILSTSDIEGSHVALAEGVVSGAIPIARRWPGIETLWPEEAIYDDIDAAVERILSLRDVNEHRKVAERFQRMATLDSDRVLTAWWHLLNGHIRASQAVFGPVDWTGQSKVQLR